jgi:hypothetical protein
MDKLAKLLFPHNPKWVRYRKMQSLFFTVLLTVISCAAVGVLVFFLSRARGK